jgi:type II secretory pathway pseudopilin PulG
VKNSGGITLIEMMIAMAISSFLLLGLTTIFSQARTVYRVTERIARTEETLRFAQAILRSDIEMAHFLGRTVHAENLDIASGITITCRKRDVTDWAFAVTRPVESHPDFDALPCAGTQPRTPSDTLVIRRARTQTGPPLAGSLQLSGNGRTGTLYRHPVEPSRAEPGDERFEFGINAYYVSDRSNDDESVPALRRLSLVRDVIQDQEVISGISDLEVQLGIDMDGDRHVDIYSDDHDQGIGAVKSDGQVVAVRFRLGANSEYPGYRRELTQTVFLRNAQRTDSPLATP